jgi:hypothetical protein
VEKESVVLNESSIRLSRANCTGGDNCGYD